jgi:hypothetical protein
MAHQNPDYWKLYRSKQPDAVIRNREKQKVRDAQQHLRDLANNTSALDLKHSAAAGWLLNADAAGLLRNNSSDLCLGRHLDHGVAQCFGLRPELGLGSCTMTYLVTKKNFGIVGFSLGEHVMNDSRELMSSGRNGQWRSELGAHAAKKIAECRLTAK